MMTRKNLSRRAFAIGIITAGVCEAATPIINLQASKTPLIDVGSNPNFLKNNSSKSFGDFLDLSDKVIGLAGTANEQAIHAGIPVFSFVGTGPQSSKKRFLEQQQLLSAPFTSTTVRNHKTIVNNSL